MELLAEEHPGATIVANHGKYILCSACLLHPILSANKYNDYLFRKNRPRKLSKTRKIYIHDVHVLVVQGRIHL